MLKALAHSSLAPHDSFHPASAMGLRGWEDAGGGSLTRPISFKSTSRCCSKNDFSPPPGAVVVDADAAGLLVLDMVVCRERRCSSWGLDASDAEEDAIWLLQSATTPPRAWRCGLNVDINIHWLNYGDAELLLNYRAAWSFSMELFWFH